METKYTPGPWQVEGYDPAHKESNGVQVVVVFSQTHEVARCRYNCCAGLPLERADANARLIAAAPELVEALGELCTDLAESHAEELDAAHYGDDPDSCLYCRHLAAARAAIAKATG